MAEFKNATSYSYSPGYTFPGNLPTELFYAATTGTPKLSDMFSIRQGIRTDEYLILVNSIDKILAATQGCEPSYTTAGTLSDRKISVGTFSANLKWCKQDFISTASVLSNDPKFVADGLDGYDATAAVRKFWIDGMIDAMRRDIWRIVLFGNDTSSNANYNVIEGLLVKLLDANASYCVKQVGNDFGNANTTVLTSGEALEAFRKTFENAQIPLKQLPASEKIFWVTGDVYMNLLRSYESTTSGSETQFQILTDGTSILKYRGIQVEPLWIADQYLTDSTNPWYNNLRNFIIYTTKASSRLSNLVLGTENASHLNQVKVFFDEKDDVTYAKSEMKFGVQFIRCDLTAIYH
jgi:hypothetical protein